MYKIALPDTFDAVPLRVHPCPFTLRVAVPSPLLSSLFGRALDVSLGERIVRADTRPTTDRLSYYRDKHLWLSEADFDQLFHNIPDYPRTESQPGRQARCSMLDVVVNQAVNASTPIRTGKPIRNIGDGDRRTPLHYYLSN